MNRTLAVLKSIEHSHLRSLPLHSSRLLHEVVDSCETKDLSATLGQQELQWPWYRYRRNCQGGFQKQQRTLNDPCESDGVSHTLHKKSPQKVPFNFEVVFLEIIAKLCNAKSSQNGKTSL